MSKIILVVILVIAVGYLFEMRRRKSGSGLAKPSNLPGVDGQRGSYLTADEAGPTETGKFRVEKLLNKNPELRPGSRAKEPPPTSAPTNNQEPEEDESALPDPFERK